MVVNDNSISFYCRPVLIQKIIGFCSSCIVMLLLSGCFLIIKKIFLELLKSPDLILISVFCVFILGFFLLSFVMYLFFSTGLSHYTCITSDIGVITYYSKRIFSSTKVLGQEDYILINFIYSGTTAAGSYGITIRLKRKKGFGHYFLWRTILEPVGLNGQKASYKMSQVIENQIKEVFPDLTVINRCKERSSWRKDDM